MSDTVKRSDPKAGEIWTYWTNPSRGASELQGVVITITALHRLPHRVVAPLTFLDTPEPYAWLVPIASVTNHTRQIMADATQSSCVGLGQFVARVGKVSGSDLQLIREAVALCLGLNT